MSNYGAKSSSGAGKDELVLPMSKASRFQDEADQEKLGKYNWMSMLHFHIFSYIFYL